MIKFHTSFVRWREGLVLYWQCKLLPEREIGRLMVVNKKTRTTVKQKVGADNQQRLHMRAEAALSLSSLFLFRHTETQPLDPDFQQDGQRFTGVRAHSTLPLSPHIQMLASSQQHQYLDNHMPAFGNQELGSSSALWNDSRMRNSFVLCSDFHVRTIEEMMVDSSSANHDQKKEPMFPSSQSLIDEMFPGARTGRTSPDSGTSKANLHGGEYEHERGGLGSGLPTKQSSASLSNSTLRTMEQV